MNVLTSIVYTISKIQQFKHQRRLEVVQNEITTHFMHSSISRSQPSTSTERSDESKVLPFNILKGRRRNAIGPIVDVEDPASNQPGFQMGSCCFKSVTLNYLISIIFIVMYCIWMFGALNYVGLIHVIDIYKYVYEFCIKKRIFFTFYNFFCSIPVGVINIAIMFTHGCLIPWSIIMGNEKMQIHIQKQWNEFSILFHRNETRRRSKPQQRERAASISLARSPPPSCLVEKSTRANSH